MKKNRIGIEDAKLNYKNMVEILYPLLKPYFNFSGKIDLSKNDPTYNTAAILARLLDYKIAIEDNEEAHFFCADDVTAEQIIVEDDGLMKFWGIVYWLDTPKDYEINKTGKDPFYAELRITKDTLRIEKMSCGDYDKTNLNRYWWFDMKLNWIFEFDE